mgnify:CR=1 FL=1
MKTPVAVQAACVLVYHSEFLSSVGVDVEALRAYVAAPPTPPEPELPFKVVRVLPPRPPPSANGEGFAGPLVGSTAYTLGSSVGISNLVHQAAQHRRSRILPESTFVALADDFRILVDLDAHVLRVQRIERRV